MPAAIEVSDTIGPALARLCSMKRTVELTPHQLETWLAVLSIYEPAIVNESVLRIGLSEDPFPDLGKLVMLCDSIRREKAGTTASGSKTLGTASVRKIASAIGLKLTE